MEFGALFLTFLGYVSMLVSNFHYSVDILLGAVITFLVFKYYLWLVRSFSTLPETPHEKEVEFGDTIAESSTSVLINHSQLVILEREIESITMRIRLINNNANNS